MLTFVISARNLNPGGYIEVVDIRFPMGSDDGTLPLNSALRKWSDGMLESARRLGRYSNSAESYKSQMVTAGFEDVVELVYKWPQNRWPTDPKIKEIGKLPIQSFRPARVTSSTCLQPFGVLGMIYQSC